MKPSAPNPYLRTKILTASAEELRLMLYDGAIKFCTQAKAALDKKDIEAGYHSLMRAQKIVLELSTSLNHKVAPDLCARMGALYTYIYRRLVDANLRHDAAAVGEAIELLEYEKSTWQLLMQRLAKEGASDAASGSGGGAAGGDGPRQTAISSLSTNG